MDTLEKITETVRLFNAPVSMRQIAEATGYSLAITSRALAKLVSQGVLEMVGSGNTRYYQIRTAQKSKEEINLETRFVELSEALDEKIVRHDRRIERVEKETEHLYTNMISIVPFQDKCCRGNRRINIQNIQEWRMAPAFGRCHFSFAVLDRSTILILCIL